MKHVQKYGTCKKLWWHEIHFFGSGTTRTLNPNLKHCSLPVWQARQHIAFLSWPAFGYNDTSQDEALGFLWCPSLILCTSHISVFIFFTASLREGVRGGIHWRVHGNGLSQGYKARYTVQIEPRASPSQPRSLLVSRIFYLTDSSNQTDENAHWRKKVNQWDKTTMTVSWEMARIGNYLKGKG